MFDINEMASICRAWFEDPDSALALITLVEKEGSSYRQPGARMYVKKNGTFIGSISGGCLEGDLVELALEMAHKGISEGIEKVDTRPIFGCNGTITLFIETISSRRESFNKWMTELNRSIEQRSSIVLKTNYELATEPLGTTILKSEPTRPGHFVQALGLKKRLIVVGAHGDVEPVIMQARSLGWEAAQVIPGSQRHGWICEDPRVKAEALTPEEMVVMFPADEGTAVVIMTHNIGRDVQYAHTLLKEDYAYMGMLGSLKRRNEVFEHILATEEARVPELMDKLYCPVGLDIGAETQEEIALSIISEVKAVFSSREGSSLKNRSKAIHPTVEIS